MKKLLLLSLGLLASCASFQETWDKVDKEALLRGALRAATLYVSIEHPELAPHVRMASSFLNAPAEERPIEVVRTFREKLLVNPPEGISEGGRVALIALADAVEEAYLYNPEILDELGSLGDTPETINSNGQIPFPTQ